ncbi:MAG TPA: ThaI family type II restriction endonuclease [Ignavibacteriaceae bacterium]|nr:ThaI family type II restriction endonuclease [Ignavibacterium sp.]HRN25437.1 ThaI family type II restriction endonuclease [Ignavibacteriaceae bacterium]HRP91592.1 ThaI family type II restriction endonuclease [Ignavibacteriaceae bacterium]HRQ53201.1 ThaI family type II restriction endonuclease [Ignavibacteriaceae bacterium]
MALSDIFTEVEIVTKIQDKLPKLFQIAELESQRAGKIGMEVGSIRERIIVSLLVYKFGEENVETELPITEPEIDVKLFGNPISIKTKSGTSYSGVKLIWTVDADNAIEFQNKYKPSCDMIFVQINWGNNGGLFYFPRQVQEEIFNLLGKENYIKLPPKGTNPRGVELSSNALKKLVEHKNSKKIDITWIKEKIEFNAFKRWIDLWAQE